MKTVKRECFGLEIEEVEQDRLSSKVRCIRAHQPPAPDFKALVDRGEELCQKVSYLPENLRLLEADREHEVVTLRSVAPDQVNEDIRYFEMRLKADGAMSLGRFQYAKTSGERKPIDFILSNDVLERLGRDLA